MEGQHHASRGILEGHRWVRRLLPLALVLWLTAPATASADTGGAGGGYVDDTGTPVAEVTKPGGSGNGSGSAASTCRYSPVNMDGQTVYDPDGNEVVHDEPGQWYIKRCVDAVGDETSNELIWVGDVDPRDLAQQAKQALPLPRATVRTSPDSGGDQLVGVPTWLWLEGGWGPRSATASLPGIAVTVTATPLSVVWEMGDGNRVVCNDGGTPYDPSRRDDEQSSDCSHTYRRSSAGQPNDRYTARATLTWDVAWTASGIAGGGGLGRVSRTSTFTLRVAEAQALNR